MRPEPLVLTGAASALASGVIEPLVLTGAVSPLASGVTEPLVLTGAASPLASGFMRRRLLRDTAWVLVIVALLLAIDAAATLLWQEPVTAVIALVQRSGIDRRELSISLTELDRHALANLTTMQERIAFLARREQRMLRTGAAIGHIEIPRIRASFEVVQGTDAASLELGPGHYPGTALPGLGETVAIAGHRTTYLEPFRDINELAADDRIIVRMPYATFSYVVQSTRIVTPTSDWVLDNVGYDRLVLSACNPLYSAAQRIVVFARLQEVRPAPVARVPAAHPVAVA